MANRLTKLVAAIVFIAGTSSLATVASATPPANGLAIKNAVPASVETVQWRRGWGYRGGWGWGGVGAGFIDSNSQVFGAQGQDFTFNILTAAGVSYKVNDHWKATAGVLYQHLSNGGQTDPNPSLNLLGPQLGLTYSF